MVRPRPAALLSMLVLLCACAVFIGAVVVVTQLDAYRTEQARKVAWHDSASSQVFGFERQLIQLRWAALLAQEVPGAASQARLRERYELFISRVAILRESAALEEFRGPQHRELMAHVDELLTRMDALLARPAMPPADLQAVLDLLAHMLPDTQNSTTQVASATARLIDAQFINLQRQSSLIFWFAAGQLVFVVLTGYALNGWRRRQEQARQEQDRWTAELREAKLAAEAGAQAKSRFLANMSHELRTPFQGVLGMLQLLHGTGLDARQQELLQTARESANHLMSVLNDILDVSAIESGSVVLHQAPLQLRTLCEEIEALMSVQALARGVLLQVTLPEDMPDWVGGDATRIKQILFNLINNAIKFTPEGKVSLDVQTLPANDGQWRCQFAVEDTGIGMTPEMLARLFRRFEPGETGVARRFSGTGLGLEISRNLALMMGGNLTVTSQAGIGSRFVFSVTLPACPAPDCLAADVPAQPGVALQVLVADDHPVNRRYLELVLQAQGHQVTLCDNGEEAVEIVQTGPFDVVLMDVHMPVMDGLAATRAIRALRGPERRVPIIAVTADVMPGAVARCLEAGADAFISKPVQESDLALALSRVTRAQMATSAPAMARPAADGALPHRLSQLQERLPRERLAELLRMFFAEAPYSISQLQQALRGGDAAAPALAHRLKGSAHVVGVEAVARVAREIEIALAEAAPPGTRQALALQLEQALQQERRRLAEWLDVQPEPVSP